MISLTAEYALRAAVHLAAMEDKAVALTVGQIARGTLVPEGYLSKVLQALARVGLITSQRGAGGGFRLQRPAAQISVYEVVQAIDPVRRIEKCPLGLEAHGTQLCPLHQQLDDAAAVVETKFRSVSLLDMIATPQARAELQERSEDGGQCLFPLPDRSE